MSRQSRYAQIIEHIFHAKYRPGARQVEFSRGELEAAAQALGIRLPKNLGDVVYAFRYRRALPASVAATAPEGEQWIIRAAGESRYQFVPVPLPIIHPRPLLAEVKVPDSTPGMIEKYALDDEQALLAKVRYNRLIDLFSGVTCYSLQSHLRTKVPGLGQLETDELYVGLDRRGVHYVLPVQAKSGRDKLGIVQIEQDFALCAHKFPDLVCRPIAAQFMRSDLIALFEFEQSQNGIAVSFEKHYRLVPPDEVSADDLRGYRTRPVQ